MSKRAKRDEPGGDAEPPPPASGATTALVMVFFTLLGVLLTIIGTTLQGRSLAAYNRQAVALEAIAASLKAECATSTPARAAPLSFQENGAEQCRIHDDGPLFRIEGENMEPCERFLFGTPNL